MSARTLRKSTRQTTVLNLLLKGLSAQEISEQVGVGVRTIQRDIQTIRSDFNRKQDQRQLRSWALADAEWWMLWREAWALFHRPALGGENDRLPRNTILNTLVRIKTERDHLAFGTQIPPTPNPEPVSEEAIAQVINLIEPDDRRRVIENVRKRIAALEKST